jgi:phage tail P2-like protein
MTKSDLLPINATKQERDISLAIERPFSLKTDFARQLDPQNCDIELLPWLAWANSVDNWTNEWTDQQKRNAVENSIPAARIKGTRKSVEDALTSIGASVVIKEWFEGGGIVSGGGTLPYTFSAYIVASDTSAEMQASIDRQIRLNMPARCQFNLIFGETGSASLSLGAWGRPATFSRLTATAER